MMFDNASEVTALLRRLDEHHHLMRLQDGTVRLLQYRLRNPIGDEVSLDLFRSALPYLEGVWAPADCERYRLNNRGRALLDLLETA